MPKSYASDREEFIARIVKEACAVDHPDGRPTFAALVDLARGILKDAQIHQGIAVRDCNYGLTPRDEARRDGCRRRILAALAQLGPGFGVGEFGGDPRGATVKIRVPSGFGDDFGGRSHYCVPVRG